MISGHKNPSHYVCSNKGLRPALFWDSIFAIINQLSSLLKTSSFRVVVDAFFAKVNFIQPMIDKGISVITRLRKDAVGWDDPEAYSGRGRPKKYGKKYKLENLPDSIPYKKLKVKMYGKETQVSALSSILWLRNIKKKIEVVLIKTRKNPIILMSTDIKLTCWQIIEIYSSRFSIEIAIRDLKQHFGLGDYQCRNTLPIIRFVRLSCVSFCLWKMLLLPEIKCGFIKEKTSNIISESEWSIPFLRRCLIRFVLKRSLFPNSGNKPELGKNQADIDSICRFIS